MDGYCRSFDAVDEGFVEVGYFKDGVSQGKYQSYRVNGDLIHQGIKEKAAQAVDFKRVESQTNWMDSQEDSVED